MQPLPFLLLQSSETLSVVLAGLDPDGSLVGFDPVRISMATGFDLDAVSGIVSVEPAAVYHGMQLEWAESEVRMVANRTPRFAPRGNRFPLLPPEAVSGFPVAESVIRRHRMRVPSVDAIRVSALFAVSTVRTTIDQAEKAFNCFGELYRAKGRQMPDPHQLRKCFAGLQNSKTAIFNGVAQYAPTMHAALAAGHRDRELRRVLALEMPPPDGLGLAKLSFTLALLGQDTICLDARLLSLMFPREPERTRFEKSIAKRNGRLTEKGIAAYEAAEDAFLAGNPYYDAKDPVGRARAQWMSWEGVGKKGAEHRVWLNLLPAA